MKKIFLIVSLFIGFCSYGQGGTTVRFGNVSDIDVNGINKTADFTLSASDVEAGILNIQTNDSVIVKVDNGLPEGFVKMIVEGTGFVAAEQGTITTMNGNYKSQSGEGETLGLRIKSGTEAVVLDPSDLLAYTPLVTGAVPVIESFTQNIYTSSTNTMTIDKPAGTVEDDLLIVIQSNSSDVVNAQYDDTSDPTGWTFVGEYGDDVADVHTAFYFKIAGPSEGTSYDFSLGALGTATPGDIACIRISGANAINPIGVIGTPTTGASATSVVVPEITTANANSLALYKVSTDGSDMAPFTTTGTGWAEVDEIDSPINGAGGTEGSWGTKDMPTAGLTGSPTVSWSVADGYLGLIIEIRSE